METYQEFLEILKETNSTANWQYSEIYKPGVRSYHHVAQLNLDDIYFEPHFNTFEISINNINAERFITIYSEYGFSDVSNLYLGITSQEECFKLTHDFTLQQIEDYGLKKCFKYIQIEKEDAENFEYICNSILESSKIKDKSIEDTEKCYESALSFYKNCALTKVNTR